MKDGTASTSRPGTMPLVSIGLPVYNGARFLRRALDSLLAQDYPNLELIISDNGSTDATPEICQEYARRDARVSYHRAEQNHGLVWNHNRTLDLARGEFFMWAGVNDVRDPTYVRRCVERLQEQPEAVLCYTTAQSVKDDGSPGEIVDRNIYVKSSTPAGRMKDVMEHCHSCNAIYGVIRTAALRRVGPMRPSLLPDLLLLTGLAILGPFAYVDEVLHQLRWREPEEWDAFVKRQLAFVAVNVSWFHRRFPATQYLLDHLRMCWQAPTSLRDRMQCVAIWLRAFPYTGGAGCPPAEWPQWCRAPMRLVKRSVRRLASLVCLG